MTFTAMAQQQWSYQWVRCPTCQTKCHRRVRTPGNTVRRCNVCGHTFTVAVTSGTTGAHVTVSPLKGV